MCLGIPGEIVASYERDGLRFGRVRFGGVTREVCLDCMPELKIGEWVLVHVGFAIARIDAVAAARALAVLEGIGQTAELDADEAAEGGG
jgi:hydrogenase expression/formation protein HypC